MKNAGKRLILIWALVMMGVALGGCKSAEEKYANALQEKYGARVEILDKFGKGYKARLQSDKDVIFQVNDSGDTLVSAYMSKTLEDELYSRLGGENHVCAVAVPDKTASSITDLSTSIGDYSATDGVSWTIYFVTDSENSVTDALFDGLGISGNLIEVSVDEKKLKEIKEIVGREEVGISRDFYTGIDGFTVSQRKFEGVQ